MASEISISVGAGQSYSALLLEFKRQLVQHALTEARGSVPRAARTLGIAKQNMYRLMKELDIQPTRRRASSRLDEALHAMGLEVER